MKKLIYLFLLFPSLLLSQIDDKRSVSLQSPSEILSNYKYIVINNFEGDLSENINFRRRLAKNLIKNLKNSNQILVNLNDPQKTHNEFPRELLNNPELGVYLNVITQSQKIFETCFKPVIELYDYEENFLSQSVGPTCGYPGTTFQKTINQLLNPSYFPTDSNKRNTVLSLFEDKFDINSEKSIRDYLDLRELELEDFEGIYRYSSSVSANTSQYKFLILKYDYIYYGFLVEANCVGCENWTVGDFKFEMTEAAVPNLFDVSWRYPDKERRRADKLSFSGDYNGGILKGSQITLLKLYPKLNSLSSNNNTLKSEWSGSGSGIIFSKSGHIVTNNHVIENANQIEVEFILNGEVEKFNAEIVQKDKVNDLAILKIVDINFNSFEDISYNFKTRSSDVGTKVYAFGYPMALTAMGKEIKVTDGIISSKTGFDGNITTYQISAPIQKGNSGGPLFDDSGNFIGINTSGIRKDIADNVGYTIKSNYVLNLIDVLPGKIDLPSSSKLESLSFIEQVKEISKFVVLVKIK